MGRGTGKSLRTKQQKKMQPKEGEMARELGRKGVFLPPLLHPLATDWILSTMPYIQ